MTKATEYLDMAEKCLDGDDMEGYGKAMAKAKAMGDLELLRKKNPDEDAADEPPKTPVAGKTARPPFGKNADADNGGDELTAKEKAFGAAAKAIYISKYKEFDPAFEQVANELYDKQGGYYSAHYYKAADFQHYLKTGDYDRRLNRIVVLTKDQIALGVLGGVSIAEIKATQIEAQDTLGGLSLWLN